MNNYKKAIITGITGQDGAYLAELLLSKGYKVYGTFRRTSSTNFWRIDELGIKNNPNLTLIEYDLLDSSSAYTLINKFKPDEVYNLAAQSFVGVSFNQPIATGQITGIGALNLLDAIKNINKKIKFYQASTSEMFGKVAEIPQTEKTRFHPRSPYGVAKLFAHWITLNYQESYDMFCSSGILFNHESPLRGKEFVTRKVTDSVAKIVLGKLDYMEIGNLDAKRDWGFAKDYVEGMYRIMQHKNPDVFVLATNRTESVRNFISMTFKAVDVELIWEGSGENEIGLDRKTKKILVRVNPDYYRPAEVDLLIGDPSKAKKELGWNPKTNLETLCRLMIEKDLERNKNGDTF